MFSGLSSLVIEDVTDQNGVIVVRARTAGGPVPCPRCGAWTGHVHGYCERTVADVPADGYPAGTPQEALDCACGLYLGDPAAWLTQPPPTN